MSPTHFFTDPLWLFAIAVFLAAGAAKGIVGLGLPTLAMALLALRMPPAQAAALLVLPSLVTNVWQMRPWPTLPALARRLAPMQAGVVAGTLLGAWWMGAPSGAWAVVALGLALIAYGGWGLIGATLPQLAPRAQAAAGPVIGALTGLVTAATGVFVLPAVPYLQAPTIWCRRWACLSPYPPWRWPWVWRSTTSTPCRRRRVRWPWCCPR